MVGGQRSVSLSDAIQAGIMLVSFVILPFVMMHHYGSWADLIGEDCPGKYYDEDGNPRGCLYVQNFFYLTRFFRFPSPIFSARIVLGDGIHDIVLIGASFGPL